MKKTLLPFLLLWALASCRTARNGGRDDGRISIIFVQVNDVYEIAPLSGGSQGGMARVASLKKKYKTENENSFLVLAGDFLSPSVYNSLSYQGRNVRGRQMVEAMNAAGMDFVCFGNHEFDIKENELADRINESQFSWISSNTFHQGSDGIRPFQKNGHNLPATYILTVHDRDGTRAQIGLIGICLPFNKAPYVHYEDPVHTARVLYDQLRDSVDAVVAITHQALADDIRLAQELPGLACILGGHEHDQHLEKQGKVFISKALSNARSAYVVQVDINTRKHRVRAQPRLELLDASVPLDSATDAVVQKWGAIAEKNFGSLGFDVHKSLPYSGQPLDGREAEIRSHPTALTDLVVSAMQAAAPQAQVVLLNAGSIRVDDILTPPLTQYDVLRTLPFGGGIREAGMKGALLLQILEAGVKNRGSGGFLHVNKNLSRDAAGNWTLDGSRIDPALIYRVAMTEFLFTGGESNLDYLKPGNPMIVTSYPEPGAAELSADIRKVVIAYLESRK